MLSRCALQQFTAKLCSTILARACKNTIRAEKCSHSARYSNSLQNCAPPFSRVLVKIQFVLENALTVRVTAIHCKPVLHHSRACLYKYKSCGKMLSQCALQQFTAKLCSTILTRACKI